MGRSDMVRRAMSKKKHKVMEEERKNFIYGILDKEGNIEVPGCIRNGISEEVGNKIFDSMMDFASYAFNKSHAAAYAVVGYQTAYLMRYYPVETIAAMLNSVMGNSDKVAHYIKFAEDQGIQVKPPNINEGYGKFTVNGDSIIFGMAAIRNVGVNVIDSIVRVRKEKGLFTSLEDFIDKLDTSAVNKRAIESLIKSGALDVFNVFRSKMLAVFEKAIDSIVSERKRNIEGQMNLFALSEDTVDLPKITYPNIKEFSKANLLAMEKEMTGLYLTGHPLDEYKSSLEMQVSVTIDDINKSHAILEEGISDNLEENLLSEDLILQDNDKVVVGGILTEINRKVTRKNTLMAFLKLEDLTGTIEVVVFPKILERLNNVIQQDKLVIVKGRVNIREEEVPKIICDDISGLEKINNNKIFIRISKKSDLKEAKIKIQRSIKENNGSTPIYVFILDENRTYRLPIDLWVDDEDMAVNLLKDEFGEENVKLVIR